MSEQPMKDLYTEDIFTTNDALYWVGDAFAFQSHKIITDHPWAKTVKLTGSADVAFLKILPAISDKSANTLGLISELFPTQVPKLIKSDPQAGYFLYRNHEGQELGKKADDATKKAILSQYADIQIAALQHPGISKTLSQFNCADQYDRLLDFLAESGGNNTNEHSTINAAYFIRSSSAEQYRHIFQATEDMFKIFLKQGDALAPTLNHCDLRPSNIAKKPDGSLIFYDWDDAVFGPPGLSLPAMFSGVMRAYKATNNFKYITNDKQRLQDRLLIGTYIKKLDSSDAYTRDQLAKCLPAVICAGAMQYIVSFAKYPVKSSRLRETIARNIQRRLSDLMNLAHYLALVAPENLPGFVSVLQENGRKTRADRLISRSKKYLGIDAKTGLKKLSQPELIARSDVADVFPSVEITKDELRAGTISTENKNLSVALFKRHGALMLKNAIPLDLVNTCHDEFHTLYDKYLQKKKPDDALRVGDKRFMVTLKFTGIFSKPDLYASPLLMPILNALLGKDAILGSLTAVASLPGSTDQRMHKDNTVLFKEAPALITPSVSISLIVPLIALSRKTGATRIIKGSHRIKSSTKPKLPYQDPIVGLGGCYLMDSRLSHRGMANNSNMIRPIVSLVYQRTWYRDHIDFKKQKPLDITARQLDNVPKPLQHLVNWAVE